MRYTTIDNMDLKELEKFGFQDDATYGDKGIITLDSNGRCEIFKSIEDTETKIYITYHNHKGYRNSSLFCLVIKTEKLRIPTFQSEKLKPYLKDLIDAGLIKEIEVK